MAATLQHCTPNNRTTTTAAVSSPNPQLKRLVYSKYRELLGSYNDQANAYIETLPSYMVHKDNGFNLELKNIENSKQNGICNTSNNNEMYGSGQRMPAQQTYEAPACVQNAMMTKDKKPFTYTPGGIDLSQIKSERMAKRLARNAQAEGATGQQQQNRPTLNNQSPGSASPNAAAAMGAAAMGMPFQVLPPPPPPAPGKNFNGGSAPAPPPPPPSSSSNFSNTGTTLAPPTNGSAGGRGSAPNSPSMPRKSPTPQRFEPPPMGFRPEIKIPPNPMAALRKVPPPVEKNTFWKDEYVKERSKSPMVETQNTNNSSGNNNSNSSYNLEQNDSVNSASSSPQTTTNANSNGTATMNNDNIDGFKKTMPTTTTNNNNILQQNQTNNNNYTNYQPQQQQQIYTPPTPPQQLQQSPIKPMQHSPQYNAAIPTAPITPPQQQQTQYNQQQSPQQQQQQQSSRPEFRSVAAPTSPAVNVYTRQTDSPRSVDNATPPRVSESPFRFAQQQQQQQQQRAPPAVSPLAQQSSPSTGSSGASVSPSNPAQTVPWRTQRSQPSQQQAQPVVAQSHPQPIYNNVQPQQQQQRTPDFSTQTAAYQGPKPTNVGSLYIAPLAPPTEPQAQHIVRQQLQQQQQQRDSPMRQMPNQQQQQQSTGAPTQQLRWMSSQPVAKEQPAWARPEENGNVVPSSLNRIKSPPPTAPQQQQQPPQHMYQQQQQQPLSQGNGFMPPSAPQNFGAQPINSTGLRLQINSPAMNQANQNGPKERIIPIQLEQTPTYTPAQPSFVPQQQQFGAGSNPAAPGYVMRTPNQFVDQGYNNFGQQQQQQQAQPQRVMSPTLQQLNAPRMVQQTQNNVVAGNKTHIIPIALESNEGTRGPISKTPIVIQNDQRTPPVQSKSFRILQKITDTIDDGSNDDNNANQQQQQQPVEPQLQRPTFARQMSAQQARHSPTVEQMRRMQIGHEQGNYSTPTTPTALKYKQQLSYDNSQQYLPPSEQQAPEPKKYTGSAIPSRSFKILQAMTQPENADEQENSENNNNNSNNNNNNQNNNEMNEIESKPESNDNDNNRYSYASNASSTVEPVSSCSSSSINSELAFSSSPSPTPPPTQPIAYPPYPYPYAYPWYPPPPPHITQQQNGENCSVVPPTCYYPYPIHAATPPPGAVSGESSHPYPPYPYYYPYPYPIPPPPPHQMSPFSSAQNSSSSVNQSGDYDLHNIYAPYMPPSPYIAYPYPVAPSYSQSSNSSRASSMLPDIIITPSTDDVPSQVIMKHHIKVDKDSRPQRAGSIEIEDVSSLKSNPPSVPQGSVVDVLTQHLENMSKSMENNLNSKQQAKKSYKKNIAQKSPEENTSPVQISMITEENEEDSSDKSSDSEITPKQTDKKGPVPLKSIRSVNNVQIYNQQNRKQEQEEEGDSSSESESETETESEEEEDDDETTADGESDIFDEEEDEVEPHDYEMEQQVEEDSDGSEEFIMDDSLSVIYEEESEMEKSSDMAKTVIRGDRSSQSADLSLDKDDPPDDIEHKIEDNDMEEEEERDDSTSVTVRLPLKFSFSTSKDAENIATLEVGKSQIEERRNSLTSTEKRNSFSVATVKSDSEDEEEEENNKEDCDVSVTISLSNSSKSNSWADKKETKSNEEIPTEPQQELNIKIAQVTETYEEESEDVSVSFSLSMRNKFAQETLNDGITNNIAMAKESPQKEVPKSKETCEKVESKSKEFVKESSEKEVQKSTEAPEELDFFATLMATKMQAQKIKEQSASYWGKFQQTKEGKQEKEEVTEAEVTKEEVTKTVTKEEVQVSLAEVSKKENQDTQEKPKDLESKEAKLNFWNSFPTKKETEAENKEEENKPETQLKKVETKAATSSSANKTKKEVKSKKEVKTKKVVKSKKEEGKTESTEEVKIEKETKEKETKTIVETSVAEETQDLESKENKINFWNKYSTKAKIETETKVEVTTTETLAPKAQLTEDICFTKSQEVAKPQATSNDKTKVVANKAEEEPVKKPKFSFWDRCESSREKEKNQTQKPKDEKVQLQKPKEVLDASFWERYSTPVRQLEVTCEKAEGLKQETKVEETKSWEHYSTNVSQLGIKSETATSSTAKSEEAEESKEETKIEETKSDEIEDIWAGRDEDDIVVKKSANSYWNNYSKIEETATSSTAKDSEEVVDIWADRVEDLPPIKPLKTKLKSLESAKDSFWSTFSEATKDTSTECETKIEKPLPKAEFINRIEFKVKLHTFSLKDIEVKTQNASVHYEEEEKEQESTLQQEEEPEEEVDFWAQIEKSKENKQAEPKIVVNEPSYYNNYGEQETVAQQTSYYAPLGEQHTPVEETSYNYAKEEQQTLVPESSYSYPEAEQQTPVPESSYIYPQEEQQTFVPESSYNYPQEDQQTFVPESSYNYPQKEQQTPLPESSYSYPQEEQQTPVPESSYNYPEQQSYVQETPYISSFGEQEYSMYNDDGLSSNPPPFDPLKYPEEPREVDTDEEIDFWAEIEAKKQTADDDVTFHKSASFWASRERQNSVEETPYKPVLPKAFPAKLPDEPPVQNIDIWQALEAHKGEDPVIIDPQMEEEKALVQEYDEIAKKEVEEEIDDPNDDAYSVHEPVVASVWCPPAPAQQYQDLEEQNVTENEVDFWAQMEQQKQKEEEQVKPQETEDSKNERDELEIKRSNYRKAMAFFTTSIDENKEQTQERFERGKSKSKRSSRIEEETEAWDWEAVNEALQQENKEESNQQTAEVVENPVNQVFDKEQTPQFAIPPPPPPPAPKQIKKEETPLPEVFVEPTMKRLPNGLPDLGVNKFYEERKISVKSRISAFETGAVEQPAEESRRNSIKNQSLSVESYTRPGSLSRNSSSQRSESEMDEDDSGVTDMNKQLSETDTESESFPELRKMSSYQRAATHSRLFKLLQDDPDMAEMAQNGDEFQFKPSRRKIVHNVSITRKQNPKALAEAETMSQRRERLSLPLRKNTSIDADNPSTPNSPASPIMGHTANKSSVVSDKLVSELVQSLLLKSDSTHFKNLPMEKLQAAAKRVLEEELDSLDNTSVDSTPAMTPNDMKKDKSYADYYNTWSDAQGSEEIVPSKSFKALQDTRRSPWTARCPRVLGSKTINRDLARVTESPEISMRTSKSPECFRQSRENSIGRWKKS